MAWCGRDAGHRWTGCARGLPTGAVVQLRRNPRPPIRNAPDYGLDAPHVIRNLALAAIALAIGAQLLPHRLMWFAWGTAALCGVEAAAMVWASRVGKIRQRERLLDQVHWPAVSRVLDVGCGRGLLAIGAAHRVGPDGTVVGVDLWQAADLAGNHPAAIVENARKESVSDRVRIVTGDMRALPLADRSIDVVLSSLAIHNVKGETGRARAIAEIARVLRPGGVVVIQDFQNVERYATELRSTGFTVEQVSGLQFRIFPPARYLVARRPMRPS